MIEKDVISDRIEYINKRYNGDIAIVIKEKEWMILKFILTNEECLAHSHNIKKEHVDSLIDNVMRSVMISMSRRFKRDQKLQHMIIARHCVRGIVDIIPEIMSISELPTRLIYTLLISMSRDTLNIPLYHTIRSIPGFNYHMLINACRSVTRLGLLGQILNVDAEFKEYMRISYERQHKDIPDYLL